MAFSSQFFQLLEHGFSLLMFFEGFRHHVLEFFMVFNRRIKNRLLDMSVNLQFRVNLIKKIFSLGLVRGFGRCLK